MAALSPAFFPLRIATVAPVINPARNAITTIRMTVSFFILDLLLFFVEFYLK
jgi:hypothetical protein